MLSKLRYGQTKSGGAQKRRWSGLFSKMTGSNPVSPYQRMDGEVEVAKKVKMSEAKVKNKENRSSLANQEGEKKAKKKRSWKRLRQAALTTCRYIGMGAAHMSPASMYSSPDYYVDPKCWNRSFNASYKPKNPPPQTPHWTSTLMFAGW